MSWEAWGVDAVGYDVSGAFDECGAEDVLAFILKYKAALAGQADQVCSPGFEEDDLGYFLDGYEDASGGMYGLASVVADSFGTELGGCIEALEIFNGEQLIVGIRPWQVYPWTVAKVASGMPAGLTEEGLQQILADRLSELGIDAGSLRYGHYSGYNWG